MNFTYDAYEDLILSLKEYGYQFVSYHNYEHLKRCIIMRHDIDYSIEKAVELAKLEEKVGIQSTYFALVSTPFYNVLSSEVKEQLDCIVSLGHEIGLHFDEVNYNEVYYQNIGGVPNAIQKEIRLMESALNRDIKAVSMHRPSKETLQANYDLGEIVNSYGKEFFDEFKYVSDSRRRWREDVYEIIKSGKYDRLHILTHAFWYNETEKDIKQSLLDFMDKAKEERFHFLDQNITNLAEIIK